MKIESIDIVPFSSQKDFVTLRVKFKEIVEYGPRMAWIPTLQDISEIMCGIVEAEKINKTKHNHRIREYQNERINGGG
jgi:hypothetical protein